MGLGFRYTSFISRSLGDINYHGLRMCELGSQQVRMSISMEKHLKEIEAPTGTNTGKKYYTYLGFDHVSIDLDGRYGSLKLDLTKEIEDEALVGTFDVITNSGTSEHVKVQYPCWRNIHRLLKPDGIQIHIVPRTKNWRGHGHWSYDTDFFDALSEACGYELVFSEIMGEPPKELVAYSMCRVDDREFITEEEFAALPIYRK